LGALDQKVRRRMQVELKRIHREVGITFIHVTHDQEEALAMADRIAVMAEGRIEQLADSLEVYSKPASPFVAGFVGEANRFIGTVAAEGSQLALKIGEGLALPLPATTDLAAGMRAEAFVRPEHIRIGPNELPDMTMLAGTVRDVVFLGESARCYIGLEGGAEIMATASAESVTNGEIPCAGSRVRFGWKTAATIAFPAVAK